MPQVPVVVVILVLAGALYLALAVLLVRSAEGEAVRKGQQLVRPGDIAHKGRRRWVANYTKYGRVFGITRETGCRWEPFNCPVDDWPGLADGARDLDELFGGELGGEGG